MQATTDEAIQGAAIRATDVAGSIRHWGFLAHPNLPDGPGPAFLLVALRPVPTLQHYDPRPSTTGSRCPRGERRTISRGTPMPRSEAFSWGLIRLVDRLGISNEYLTFGGHLDAAEIDDIVVAAFASQAPLLSRGGTPGMGRRRRGGRRVLRAAHGGGRLVPGFEAEFGAATPLTRLRRSSATRPGDVSGRRSQALRTRRSPGWSSGSRPGSARPRPASGPRPPALERRRAL